MKITLRVVKLFKTMSDDGNDSKGEISLVLKITLQIGHKNANSANKTQLDT